LLLRPKRLGCLMMTGASSDIEVRFVIRVERASMTIDCLSNLGEHVFALGRLHHSMVGARLQKIDIA
jgi:hypothetical protein